MIFLLDNLCLSTMDRKDCESLPKKSSLCDIRDGPYNFTDNTLNTVGSLTSTKCISLETRNEDLEKSKCGSADSSTPILCNSLGGIKVFHVSSSIFANLNILKPLGKGSFAKVWLVQDSKTGQQLAAKLLQPQAFPNPGVVAKLFAKEIANLAASQCLGVVKFHRLIVGKEGILLLQEYATAGNLWQHKVPDVFGVFIQIVQALLHLRDVQVVHRDLKPTNIFMCSNGRLVIGDFGWSEMLQNMRDVNTRGYVNNDNLRYYNEVIHIMEKYLNVKVDTLKESDNENKGQEWPGTFEINPPEVLLNCGPFNEKIDNYALGMVFLMLLTGRFICRPKNKEVNAIVKGLMSTLKTLRTPNPHRSFKVSKASWNLFLGLTDPDTNSRFALEDVLHHPWTRNKFSYFCPNKWTIWHPKVRFAWINAVPPLPMNVPINKLNDVDTAVDDFNETARVDSARSITSSAMVDSSRTIGASTTIDCARGILNKSIRTSAMYGAGSDVTLERKCVSDYKSLRVLSDSSSGFDGDVHRSKNRVVDSTKLVELESRIATISANKLTNDDVKLVNRHVCLTSRISTHILQDDKCQHISTYRTPSVHSLQSQQSLNQPVMPLKQALNPKPLNIKENMPNFVPF